MDQDSLVFVHKAQRAELTDLQVYEALARKEKDPKNKKILLTIAKDEQHHYAFWKSYSKIDVAPLRFRKCMILFFASLFGVSFALRFMESLEVGATKFYKERVKQFTKAKAIIKDEEKHERLLIGMLSDERLVYASSVVLGLNDALVEISAALVGFSIALRDAKLIAITGAITGFAASLSMAASGYLSTREEDIVGKAPLKGAMYTGIAYVVTVVLLILPYVLFDVFVAIGVMIGVVLLIISLYTFYITTAKGLSFWRRFVEMAVISLGVACISFLFGLLLRKFVGV
ncbi:MAG: VIT1/CCC1 transporter family protein [Candidatus Woesearchaeota archaeon]|nr:MAG: VIT1/CCC1 transporter family protein [Candidatus Woesearchaeota archaeon]